MNIRAVNNSVNLASSNAPNIAPVSQSQNSTSGMTNNNEIKNNNLTDQNTKNNDTNQSLPLSEKVIIDTIERANKKLMGSQAEFSFSVHEITKQIMIKVIDKDTKEIIKEIPSEKALDAVAKMWELAGLLVDEKR